MCKCTCTHARASHKRDEGVQTHLQAHTLTRMRARTRPAKGAHPRLHTRTYTCRHTHANPHTFTPHTDTQSLCVYVCVCAPPEDGFASTCACAHLHINARSHGAYLCDHLNVACNSTSTPGAAAQAPLVPAIACNSTSTPGAAAQAPLVQHKHPWCSTSTSTPGAALP